MMWGCRGAFQFTFLYAMVWWSRARYSRVLHSGSPPELTSVVSVLSISIPLQIEARGYNHEYVQT